MQTNQTQLFNFSYKLLFPEDFYFGRTRVIYFILYLAPFTFKLPQGMYLVCYAIPCHKARVKGKYFGPTSSKSLNNTAVSHATRLRQHSLHLLETLSYARNYILGEPPKTNLFISLSMQFHHLLQSYHSKNQITKWSVINCTQFHISVLIATNFFSVYHHKRRW